MNEFSEFPLRGTGRTTFMLEEALTAKIEGVKVLIVMATEGEIRHALRLLPMAGLRPEDFKPLHTVAVSESLRGLTKKQVFVDHNVWDSGSWEDMSSLDSQLRKLR